MNFYLPGHTILLTLAGSRAYGMATDTSDVDLKGVVVPPKSYFLGLDRFEQADKKEHFESDKLLMSSLRKRLGDAAVNRGVEGTAYDIRKFAKLALDANPNILDALFCRDEDTLVLHPLGRRLRQKRDLFISARAKFAFSGYAMGQMKRIRTHRGYLFNPPTHKPTRTEFGLPEHGTISRDYRDCLFSQIQKKLDSWELDLSMLEDSQRIYLHEQVTETLTEMVAGYDESRKWHAAARVLGLSDEVVAALDKEHKFKGALHAWNQYESWKKNRNPARAALEEQYGYDTKHGAHLVRLMRMGKEILLTGKVNVYRGDIDAEELLAIRAGAWPYEQLEEFATTMDAELNDIYRSKSYVIPHSPDRDAVNSLVMEIVEEAF